MIQWLNRDQCLICHSRDLQKVREEGNSTSSDAFLSDYLNENTILVFCPHCDMAFVQRIPQDPRFYEALYRDTGRDVSIDFYFSGKRRIFSEIKTIVRRYLPSGKLLDLGAGTGVLIQSFAPEFVGTGVEIGESARQFGQSQKINLLAASLEQLPFAGAEFDLVTLVDVLEHLADPEQAIQEIHRVLKPGGLFFIKVPNYRAQANKQDLLQLLRLSKEGIMKDYVHINHYSPKALKKGFENSQWQIVESGFSESEIWDLRWRQAPKSLLYRWIYNGAVIFISQMLKRLSQLSGMSLGLNHYILVRKSLE